MIISTLLSIIGGITVILIAATQVPLLIATLLEACIPVATALRDLREALLSHRNEDDDPTRSDSRQSLGAPLSPPQTVHEETRPASDEQSAN